MPKIAEYIKNRTQVELSEEIAKLPLSLRLSTQDTFILQTLANKLGMRKSSLATDLLVEAMQEAWEAAELPPWAESGELRREYESFLKATKRAAKKKQAAKKATSEPVHDDLASEA